MRADPMGLLLTLKWRRLNRHVEQSHRERREMARGHAISRASCVTLVLKGDGTLSTSGVGHHQEDQMVFCRGCGKEIHETAVSCPQCGAVQHVSVRSPQNLSGTLWLPVPSLILGIIGVLALFDESSWDRDLYIGTLTLSVAAIVLGGVSISAQERGRGMSIAGIVLGVIGFLGVIGRAVS